MTETLTERAARALYIHEQVHRYKTHTADAAAAMWDEPTVKKWRDLRIASMADAIAEYEAAKAEVSAARRERAVEASLSAFEVAAKEMTDCPRCKGEGYHHGFGEHGHDPDWCEDCGGSQFVAAHTDLQVMDAAISAFERVMAELDAAQPRKEGA